jgi:hypothetical protein
MRDGESFHQADVDAVHLLQREGVIEVGFLADGHVQLPLQQLGRHPLVGVHLRAIERGELGESLAGERNPGAAVVVAFRCQPAFELFLFGTGEVPAPRGEIGIAADPFGGELAEEIVQLPWLPAGHGIDHRTEESDSRHRIPSSPSHW